MIGRRMAKIVKRFARHRDDMRFANFQVVRGLDTLPVPCSRSTESENMINGIAVGSECGFIGLTLERRTRAGARLRSTCPIFARFKEHEKKFCYLSNEIGR